MLPLRSLCAGLALALSSTGAAEEGPWALCAPVPLTPPPPQQAPEGIGSTLLSADRLITGMENTTRLAGEVQVLREGMRLEADEAEYDRETELLELSGGVHYRTPELSLQGERARVDLAQEIAEMFDTRFHVIDLHAFGAAERVLITDPQHTRLEGLTYSTCNPGDEGWQLRADSLRLDDATNTGEARGVTVRFQGVPFAYLPYINFPLRGRKSGFLAPSFGNSDSNGADLSVPYYWNIAPNRDATTTPRYMSKRGTMLLSEYRYLNEQNEGELNLDYLPHDRLFGKERGFASWQHVARPGRGWNSSVNLNYVTDDAYFDDISDVQSITSQTHLERRVDVGYRGDQWSFLGRLQGYQALTGTEPYQRLPQLRFRMEPRGRGALRYDGNAELVHFAHASREPTGTRLDLSPGVTLPLEAPAWFFRPRLAIRHTDYRLDGGDDERLTRTVPLASVDGGLYFDRFTSFGGEAVQQTLEPRLYYLYVPFRDQSAFPRFDTAEYDFSFGQLFRENRFSGADRVGDANQLTLAVASRVLAESSGEELLRAMVGQIVYFDDRQVTLTGSTSPGDERGQSDIIGELGVKPRRNLDFSTTVQYDPDQEREELLTSRLRYVPGTQRGVSLSYRLRRDQSVRQTDLAAFWPLNPQWQFIGRWNYDLENERSLETVAGLEYRSCCWSLRLVGRGHFDPVAEDIERSIYVTLELKGLANIGNALESELERGILGYR